MYIPERGDIIAANFDPSLGNEIMKRRPALVLSRKMFNDITGFVIAAPITSTVKNSNLEAPLLPHQKTKGVVLIHQMRSMHIESRDMTFIEKADQKTIEHVSKQAKLFIS